MSHFSGFSSPKSSDFQLDSPPASRCIFFYGHFSWTYLFWYMLSLKFYVSVVFISSRFLGFIWFGQVYIFACIFSFFHFSSPLSLVVKLMLN